jgi:hypothetical protein
MLTCRQCGHELQGYYKFCTQCGTPVAGQESTVSPDARPAPGKEDMNMTALYVMVAALFLAVLVPPWEAPPDKTPEFLGFYFFLDPPAEGVVSRLLVTIELFTIALAGFYAAWFFRAKTADSSSRTNDPS